MAENVSIHIFVVVFGSDSFMSDVLIILPSLSCQNLFHENGVPYMDVTLKLWYNAHSILYGFTPEGMIYHAKDCFKMDYEVLRYTAQLPPITSLCYHTKSKENF
jgi:hypothetical protein